MRGAVRNVATLVLIGLTLIAAFLLDASDPLHAHFVSASFAIPILIAAYALSTRGAALTSVLVVVVAIVSTRIDTVPAVPATFHIAGLLIIGSLATFVGEQRRVIGRRARDAEEARHRVATVLNRISDAFMAVDSQWRITFFNPSAGQSMNVAAAEVLGRNLWDAFPPLLGSRFEREYRRAVAEQVPVHFEEFFAPRDSWYEVQADPSPDGLSIYLRDATARKRSEEERERLLNQVEIERARFQAILDSVPSAIVHLDAETRQVLSNPRATALFGHPLAPEGGRAQYAQQVLHLDGRPVSVDELPSQRALGGQIISGEELLVARPDESQVPVLASAAPVRGPDGNVTGSVAVFQDISNLKELERLREEWTAIVAHDLRQPITIINGFVGMLRTQPRQPQRTAEQQAIDHIATSAHNLNRMVGDLLDASRIEARRLTLTVRMVDLSALIQDVVDRTRDTTRGHPVRVEIELATPPLTADPARIEQVLGNLLSNAAKYSDEDAEILVEVTPRELEVEVSVTNHGPGIPSEELPRLFNRFYRTREARTGRAGGLGLGLYLTKGLVEAHGGRVWAESVPGLTTTFHFTLPLR